MSSISFNLLLQTPSNTSIIRSLALKHLQLQYEPQGHPEKELLRDQLTSLYKQLPTSTIVVAKGKYFHTPNCSVVKLWGGVRSTLGALQGESCALCCLSPPTREAFVHKLIESQQEGLLSGDSDHPMAPLLIRFGDQDGLLNGILDTGSGFTAICTEKFHGDCLLSENPYIIAGMSSRITVKMEVCGKLIDAVVFESSHMFAPDNPILFGRDALKCASVKLIQGDRVHWGS
jgi:hypothetical protein